jgi:hypothetical protein
MTAAFVGVGFGIGIGIETCKNKSDSDINLDTDPNSDTEIDDKYLYSYAFAGDPRIVRNSGVLIGQTMIKSPRFAEMRWSFCDIGFSWVSFLIIEERGG